MQANKQDVGRLLKTAKGQIDGILKMIEEDRYCMEISHQIMAAEAILNKANREVPKAHVQGCVKDGIESGDADGKVQEILTILDAIMK